MGAGDGCGLDRAMREVGDGTDVRAWAISGRARGRERRRLPSRVGPTQEGTGGGGKEESERADGRMGQQARIEEGKGREKKTFFFLFSRVLANPFQVEFEFNSNLVKTNHYKNKSAATCMRQEVTNLIFDFNFTKFINFLYLNAHIIT